MLLARARGTRDALTDRWGARPERPPRPAERDVSACPVPTDVEAFRRQAYQWRVDVAVVDDAGRVLLLPNGDGWRLPGGTGSGTEPMERVAARHAAVALGGGEAELRDLLWTQLVEFDYGAVSLPALRAVLRAAPRDDPSSAVGEWVDPADFPASFEDGAALREQL